MKKMVALAAFAAVAAAATVSFAGKAPHTGVNGSLHDMNDYNKAAGHGNQDVYERVCVFCHTPHNAIIADENDFNNKLPLWGRLNGTVDQTFHAYGWATPKNTEIKYADDYLIGPSRLCLSCHDGSIGVDAHVSNGETTGKPYKLTGTRAIGGDSALEKTHPIGFKWSDAVKARNLPADAAKGKAAVNEIVDATEEFATAVNTNQLQGTYNVVTRNSNRTIESVLYQKDYFTCASCHEVHNKENAIQDHGENYFLYAKETESLICLSCHIK